MRRNVWYEPLIIKVGGPYLMSVCVAVYFLIYTFFLIFFLFRGTFAQHVHRQTKTLFFGSLPFKPWYPPIFLPNYFQNFGGMLQVTAHVLVQSVTSGDTWFISKSGIRLSPQKGVTVNMALPKTAAQLVVSGHHCITSSSPIHMKMLSQEKDFTMNAEPT